MPAPRRIAVIDRGKCIREKCGYLCRGICPPVRMGKDAIIIDEKGFPVIDEVLCTGCGLCPKKCPVSAIKVINLAGEAGDPIFQYGVNSFRLYNFALPKPSAVVALVGRNGIGKTTLLEIMSGKLLPNFMDFSRKLGIDEVIARIAHKELKNYFEQLKPGGYRISYKVQNVEMLARVAPDSTVESVLAEFDNGGKRSSIISRLNMGGFVQSKLSSLSGGELQKVAIAAAMLKDASLYFFDEPSIYLDIYERMRVAREIAALSQTKPVVVVEHDLALLDYLADYVYILYGEPGVYGVVSGVKNARMGINEFMEGYLREENIKFRERELRIELFSSSEVSKKVLFSYGEMEKSLGRFRLHVAPGDVRCGEVVGIVGPNAIGKSTFIKLIAGVEQPDSGDAPAGLKVSYKPQYIDLGFEGTVQEFVILKKIDQSYIKEFELEHLLFKRVPNLSGGEMQRLAIASALSADADIYLFDEPSAFLDIEQRMRLSSIIKRDIAGKEKVAFVVDHDLVFIDSISSRIMQFSGQSSVHGNASQPSDKVEAMNSFLKALGITLRRDKETLRPKINKEGSVLDREQREAGNYYYHVK
ncbi:MAG: ribosome biogenesis/translation initiation ATPase RLI [Candidatus Micrarchaeota archaeon]|nr:ribosome biogenesis/translation initiation ATPase RLI [Candidatus Micrarchaeota archaeon]